MSKMSSAYYPPRARWYSWIFYVGRAFRHRLPLGRFRLPDKITLLGLIGGFVVPGLAVYLRGPRAWGKAVFLACALFFLLFIVCLGHPFGNYAFGLLLAIHASGFVYYCSPYLSEKEFPSRIVFTIAILMSLGLAIYSPLRGVIQDHWLMPVQSNGHGIVVQRLISPHAVKRGDAVAYNLSGYYFSNHGGQGVSGQQGMGLGLVLALAGDRIEFTKDNFTVNGIPQPRLTHMPESGSLVVSENHWFIWPNLVIHGNWNVGEGNISSAMIGMANVSEDQFIGKPFKRWFGRKQSIP
jgi:hypothetical protein